MTKGLFSWSCDERSSEAVPNQQTAFCSRWLESEAFLANWSLVCFSYAFDVLGLQKNSFKKVKNPSYYIVFKIHISKQTTGTHRGFTWFFPLT